MRNGLSQGQGRGEGGGTKATIPRQIGQRKKTFKMFACDGTHTPLIQGHCNLETELAQWAYLMKFI